MTDKNVTPLVIKLGGAAISCSETLSAIFSAIAKYQSSAKRSIVIVHGGGCIVDDLMARLDLKPRKINGLRVTPQEDIELVAGALAGSANKVLQARAKADGLNAMGLCLADGDLCKVSKIDDELGAVGSAEPGNSSVLNVLLAHPRSENDYSFCEQYKTTHILYFTYLVIFWGEMKGGLRIMILASF